MTESFDRIEARARGRIREDLFRRAGPGTVDEPMPLREESVEAHLRDGEVIHFLLANPEAGLSVKKLARPSTSRDMTVTSGKEFRPGANYMALAAITSHRVLFLVGSASGDDVYQISLEDITAAMTPANNDRLVLLRDTNLRYGFSGGAQGSDPTAAIRFLRRVLQEELEPPVLLGADEEPVASDAEESSRVAESTDVEPAERARQNLATVNEELAALDRPLEARGATIERLEDAMKTLDEATSDAERADEGATGDLRAKIDDTRTRIEDARELIREHDSTLSQAEALVAGEGADLGPGENDGLYDKVSTVAAEFEARGIDSSHLNTLLNELSEASGIKAGTPRSETSAGKSGWGDDPFGRFVDTLRRLTADSSEETDAPLDAWYETLESFYVNGRPDWSGEYQDKLPSLEDMTELFETRPLDPDAAFVVSQLLGEEAEIRRPLAPESGTPLPLFVESEQQLARATDLLTEFPAPEPAVTARSVDPDDRSTTGVEQSQSSSESGKSEASDDSAEVHDAGDLSEGAEEATHSTAASGDGPRETSEDRSADEEPTGPPPSVDGDGLTWDLIDRRAEYEDPLDAKLVKCDPTPDSQSASFQFEDVDGERFWLRIQRQHEQETEWQTGTWYELRNVRGPESLFGERTTGSLRSADGFSIRKALEAAQPESGRTTPPEAETEPESTVDATSDQTTSRSTTNGGAPDRDASSHTGEQSDRAESQDEDGETADSPPDFDDNTLTWDDINRRTRCEGPLYAILVERDLTANLNRAGLKFEDYDGNQFWLRVQDHHEAGAEWSTGTLYELRNFFGPESLLGKRTTGSLRSASGFSAYEASEEGRREVDWTTTEEANRDDDADPEVNGADRHIRSNNRQEEGLTEVERQRVADLVALQPTKNAELMKRWGLNDGSEVHAYLKGHLDEYYHRDDNSLIQATDHAVAVVNAQDSAEADEQSSQVASDAGTPTSPGTSSELPDPAAFTANIFAGKLDEIDDLDDLQQIEKAEREGKDRVGAKEAIRERRRELEGDATDEPVSKHRDVTEDSKDAEEDILDDIEDEFSTDI